MMYKPLTIKEISELRYENDEDLLFGQFLDDFRYEESDMYALIKDEPLNEKESELFSCILAATAHKLANDNDLPVPEWVFKRKYVYVREFYPCIDDDDDGDDIKDFRQHLKATSPYEFAQRNLFFGNNVLSRV